MHNYMMRWDGNGMGRRGIKGEEHQGGEKTVP